MIAHCIEAMENLQVSLTYHNRTLFDSAIHMHLYVIIAETVHEINRFTSLSAHDLHWIW